MFQVTSHLVFGLSVLCVLISLLFFKEKLILIELDPNQEWGVLVLKQQQQKKNPLNVRLKLYLSFVPYISTIKWSPFA